MQRTRYTPKIFGIAAPLLALAVVRVLHEYGQPITEQFELIVVDVVDDFHRLYIYLHVVCRLCQPVSAPRAPSQTCSLSLTPLLPWHCTLELLTFWT